MMLCLDCGNTRIKWALMGDGNNPGAAWLSHGALLTAEASTLRHHLPADLDEAGALSIIACNVAGESVRQAIDGQLASVRWLQASAAQGGVHSRYAPPERLGADRWAALLGAHARQKGLGTGRAAVVVCAGTATTVDLLGADGEFRGGLILPGIDLMHRSLARDTAGLDVARGRYALQPRCTEDAIASGVLHATLGAIERMYRQLAQPADCVLTGGAADQIEPHLDLPIIAAPLLILEGLAVAGRASQATDTPA